MGNGSPGIFSLAESEVFFDYCSLCGGEVKGMAMESVYLLIPPAKSQ
uniref:Uncharacterized protein n=1 Tax=Anguilla anguilla TaxID=7936 RepID=A0A0E9R0A5_ANGAN